MTSAPTSTPQAPGITLGSLVDCMNLLKLRRKKELRSVLRSHCADRCSRKAPMRSRTMVEHLEPVLRAEGLRRCSERVRAGGFRTKQVVVWTPTASTHSASGVLGRFEMMNSISYRSIPTLTRESQFAINLDVSSNHFSAALTKSCGSIWQGAVLHRVPLSFAFAGGKATAPSPSPLRAYAAAYSCFTIDRARSGCAKSRPPYIFSAGMGID